MKDEHLRKSLEELAARFDEQLARFPDAVKAPPRGRSRLLDGSLVELRAAFDEIKRAKHG